MSSVIFNTGRESYQVSQILYVGPVSEIPQEHRKGDATHSFKMITTRKSVFSHYKSLENGIKARGFLVGMLEEAKPSMYKHGFELLDPAAVVSFGNVITLKTPQGEYTHAVCVTLDTAEEKYNKVWLRYKSEENAQKGRRALYAVLHSLKSQGSIEVKAEAAEALAKAA